MEQAQLYRLLFKTTNILLKMYGFLPLKFDRKTNRFRRSHFWLYYSVTILVVYSVVMAVAYFIAVHIIHHETFSLHSVFMRFQFALNYCFYVLTTSVVIMRRDKLRQLLNTLILLAEMCRKRCHVQKDYKLLKRYGRKVLLVDFGVKFIVWLSYYLYEERGLIGLLVAMNFLLVWSIAVFANGFVSLCLVVAHMYRMINLRVDGAIQVLCDFEMEQEHWKSFPVKKKLICIHVSNELNKLASLHQDVAFVVRKLVLIVDSSLFLTFLWYAFTVTFGIFYAYTALVYDIRNGVRPPLMKYGNSIGFAVFQGCQFYYVVTSAGLLAKRAEKTGILLNRLYKSDVDESVERAINMFSIELLHSSFALENFGMFKIDYSLMYSMVGTIATYLILSIQFQLSQ